MKNFVAIDFETANNHPTSICSIGAVKVVDGYIVDRFYSLVQPEPNFYFRHFTENIHGISRKDTDDAPTFDAVWFGGLKEFIGELPLVAHNKRFDQNCLLATCRCYRIDMEDNPFYCTLEAARKKIPRGFCKSYSLPCVCDALGIPFNNHHDALADAEGCAKLAMVLL